MIKALILAMPDTISNLDIMTVMPNMGIISLAGNVDSGLCDVKVADLVLVRERFEDYVLSLLREHSPDLVGFSCMTFQYHNAVKLARLVKNYDKNIAVVMGGYHPTLMYEEISASPESQFIDFIVRVEGEATFDELATAMNTGREYDKIAGLSYKTNGAFHHNPPRGLLSLDSIQLPERNARLIKKGFHFFGLPLDTIETSRGCTNKCKFCTVMYGRTFRKYEISRTIADIRDAYEHGARTLLVTDENITLDLERLERLCEEITAARLNSIHYIISASVRGIAHSKKLVQKMADAGVRTVFLGIESTSKAQLDFLGKKNITSDNTRRAVRYLRDNGILSFGGFIVGNPDDDEETLWNTFKLAWDLRVDVPSFSILTPHVKTEIRKELMAEGLITNADDFSGYHNECANIRTRHLSPEEIEKTVGQMYETYLYNLDYLKFNQVRKIYPKYFWELVAKDFRKAVLSLIRNGVRQ